MTESSAEPALAFARPPVDEVVCGLRYRQLDSLIVPYWGRLWDDYVEEFPRCEQHPPLPAGVPGDQGAVRIRVDLPRVWFIDRPGNRLIQAQTDAFFFNWRRLAPEDKYPHFDTIYGEYEQHLRTFLHFLEMMELGELVPVQFELAYIDVIPMIADHDCIADLSILFPDFRWRTNRPSSLGQGSGAIWNTQFVLPRDSGMLTISIATGIRKSTEERIMRLEMKVTTIGGSLQIDAMKPWFHHVHAVLSEAFSYLTDHEVQQQRWGRES